MIKRMKVISLLIVISFGLVQTYFSYRMYAEIRRLKHNNQELVNALKTVTDAMIRQAEWSKQISEKVYGTNQTFQSTVR